MSFKLRNATGYQKIVHAMTFFFCYETQHEVVSRHYYIQKYDVYVTSHKTEVELILSFHNDLK
ncbi:CLUMA_CG009759, isoform A [Clunio marinus]|uniref:CLUMA_CG009759, isoform A n=1 Tax=Clunio marinus TaxID=568069 RepID=A0A1J1I9U0_9DIPT|nr:CLUMA_CG009759, isoform A [Clunio marinus]